MKTKPYYKLFLSILIVLIVLNSGFFITNLNARLVFNIIFIIIAVSLIIWAIVDDKESLKESFIESNIWLKRLIIGSFVTAIILTIFILIFAYVI
ncbi:hypothetical protein [Liberiplasma polymorphum]|uniref:hypothetical protein n=1 Tax=Liberiplasma polymorphum TaxID=3374570 RepID=UPI003771E81D